MIPCTSWINEQRPWRKYDWWKTYPGTCQIADSWQSWIQFRSLLSSSPVSNLSGSSSICIHIQYYGTAVVDMHRKHTYCSMTRAISLERFPGTGLLIGNEVFHCAPVFIFSFPPYLSATSFTSSFYNCPRFSDTQTFFSASISARS